MSFYSSLCSIQVVPEFHCSNTLCAASHIIRQRSTTIEDPSRPLLDCMNAGYTDCVKGLYTKLKPPGCGSQPISNSLTTAVCIRMHHDRPAVRIALATLNPGTRWQPYPLGPIQNLIYCTGIPLRSFFKHCIRQCKHRKVYV